LLNNFFCIKCLRAPLQVMLVMDKEATAGMDPRAYLSSFAGRRKRLTLTDVNRIAKRVARDSKLDENDVAAVEQLVATWEAMGADSPLLHYQRQVGA
jgi:hypothetical protein